MESDYQIKQLMACTNGALISQAVINMQSQVPWQDCTTGKYAPCRASVGRTVDERLLAALSAESTCLERRVHFNKQQLLIGKVNKRQQSSAGSPMQPSSTIGHRHSKCQVDRPRGLPVCIAVVATQKPVTHWWRPTTGERGQRSASPRY